MFAPLAAPELRRYYAGHPAPPEASAPPAASISPRDGGTSPLTAPTAPAAAAAAVPMVHVLLVRYTVPVAEVAPHVPGHVAYLERRHADGTFLLSGQTVPDDLGGVILAVGDREHVEKAAAEDPFAVAGVAAYEIVTVEAGRAGAALRALLS
ncbi:YciI family protein [Actinomadura sp. ATCC 31491]|uniref:YciI family protein n=1 Tax=Actinomadura luzonensis TaxID=2805427 RepID=A0ABT0FJT2_9ACTN|nr:YciI family protein [Actinomadura luzonensis]MCK2212570.1 YciI family protein [Actinomadura luzonensis]